VEDRFDEGSARAVYEALLRARMPARHKDVVHAIYSLTFGWRKTSDVIAVCQIGMLTRIGGRPIRSILADLEQWKVLRRGPVVPGYPRELALNADPETWECHVRPLPEGGPAPVRQGVAGRHAPVRPGPLLYGGMPLYDRVMQRGMPAGGRNPCRTGTGDPCSQGTPTSSLSKKEERESRDDTRPLEVPEGDSALLSLWGDCLPERWGTGPPVVAWLRWHARKILRELRADEPRAPDDRVKHLVGARLMAFARAERRPPTGRPRRAGPPPSPDAAAEAKRLRIALALDQHEQALAGSIERLHRELECSWSAHAELHSLLLDRDDLAADRDAFAAGRSTYGDALAAACAAQRQDVVASGRSA